jgi:hypothetical protein
LSLAPKKSVVLVVHAVMAVVLAIAQHAVAVAARVQMPHLWMEAINPLKLRMPLKLPSSASARLPRPHPLARLRTVKENKHAATSTP